MLGEMFRGDRGPDAKSKSGDKAKGGSSASGAAHVIFHLPPRPPQVTRTNEVKKHVEYDNGRK